MFNWICPQCGRDVPPSLTECPNCAGKPAGVVETAPEAVKPEQPAQPAAPAAVQPPAPARKPAPPRRAGLPTWLMSIVFGLAFIGLGAGIFWSVQYFRSRPAKTAAPAVALETPSAKGNALKHPLQKYIEVAGVRLYQNAKKQTEARFLVVNHSEAEIVDLAGNVTVWGRTAKSEEEPVGSFPFKLASLGPNEARELTTPVTTKLKVYELPDWQNVTAEVQITSP